MKIISKFTAIILCFSLLTVFLGGCKGSDTVDSTTTGIAETTTQPASSVPQTLKLPYAKNDSVNPFKAHSMINRQLCGLLYDSLFRVDSAFKPVAVIAKDYQLEALTLTVTIKSGVKFSNGSMLGADDIVYSFNQAKASTVYAAHLANFRSVSKNSDNSVTFSLKSADPYAVNCLDFAVVADNDNRDSPAGSGRYYFGAQNGEKILRANKNRLNGFSPKIKTISLVNITDSDSLNYTLQIGNLSFVFMDLNDGFYQRVNATALEVPMNNLVYLGFKGTSGNLNKPEVRKAAALLIDRGTIAETAFQGHAKEAYTPFNPAWTAGYDFTIKQNTQDAVKLLEQAGFTKTNEDGVRYSGWGNKLSFTLLVNKDNAFKVEAAKSIVQQFWAAGMEVTVKSLKYKEYSTAVKSGKYDMYIGEVLLTPNMSLSPLLAKGGAVSSGINTSTGAASTAYKQFLNGSLDLKGFVEAFNADMPFIPLCYRDGIAAYTRALKVPHQCTAYDVYSDIADWHF